MIELHIIQPDHQIIKAQLQDGLYYAGSSSSECQLPLKFPGVSRKHLEMRVKNSVLYIKDLDSANGTLLNNVALTPNNIVQVPPNGEMQLGSIRIKINSPAAAPAHAPVNTAPQQTQIKKDKPVLKDNNLDEFGK